MEVPTITKEKQMSGIKGLVGKKVSKKYNFMDEEIQISKLMTSHVLAIQEKAKGLGEEGGDDKQGLEVMKLVIRSGAEGGAEMSDEDFTQLPLDELSKLSKAIMEYSGLGEAQGN